MRTRPLIPSGEGLRRAVRFIGEHGDHSPRAVEEAARRFDLSPLDEAFLLRYRDAQIARNRRIAHRSTAPSRRAGPEPD